MDYQYKVEIGDVAIVAGTVPMFIPQGGNHVRQAIVSLPRFKTEPVVTATVHSKDSTGPMFGIWNIQYKDEADSTVIKFSAQTLQPAGNDLHYLCSFTAMGELVHKES